MLIHWIRHTKSESDLCLYTRNLLNERLKPVLEYKITFWIYVANSQRLLSTQEAGVKFSYKSFLVYKHICALNNQFLGYKLSFENSQYANTDSIMLILYQKQDLKAGFKDFEYTN